MVEYTFSAPQQEYLATSADICLYGGSAGSGKSFIALIDLLGINEPRGPRYTLPYYNALIYRKRRGDLLDLINKSKKIYPIFDPGAVFNHTDCVWRFTSGAQIHLKYFERYDIAETFLQGQEISMLVCEEIGQFDDDRIFKYAMSRLRNSEGLKCYARATANPSRHKWIRSYWRIDDKGSPTDFKETFVIDDEGTTVTKRIKFIPARLSDNPHLPKDYMAQLLLLPEAERNALAYGLWNAFDSVDGQIYEHELELMTSQRRFCHVPFDPSISVETYFDIGMSDLTVILFVQRVGKEIRIIDMLKGNNKGLGEHWVPEILRLKDTKGYRYAKHYLPHDAAQRDKWDGISLADKAKASLRDVEVLPRLSMEVGLQLTREMFRNVWIDKDACADLHTDLSNYRREWDPKLEIWKDEPLHDKHSHGADAFRMISYYRPKPKIDISDMQSVVASNPFTFR